MVVSELLKWGGYGLMRFSGQVDGGMSWHGASPHMVSSLLKLARNESRFVPTAHISVIKRHLCVVGIVVVPSCKGAILEHLARVA